MIFVVDSGSQRQHNKCIKKDFFVPQQGVPSNAIFFSTFALKDKTQYNGSRPLILLGPNKPDEASSVLNVVRFYGKLMVRNVQVTMEFGGWVALLASIGAVYYRVITVNFRKYPPLPPNENGWRKD